jgi:hypothetical protein
MRHKNIKLPEETHHNRNLEPPLLLPGNAGCSSAEATDFLWVYINQEPRMKINQILQLAKTAGIRFSRLAKD